MLRINSINKCVIGDAPGLQYTVYLQGCPLECWYCQNPECRSFFAGKTIKVDDLIDDILMMAKYLRKSGGGVTLSGGEPLAQAKEATDFCRLLHGHSLNVTLDTAGSYINDEVKELLRFVDLILLDIKAGSEAKYRVLTRGSMKTVLEFATHLAKIKKPTILRYVLVPEVTDIKSEIETLADIAVDLGNIKRVDVLPFHHMASEKYEELNLPYILKNHPTPTIESINAVEDVFRSRGLRIS